MIEHGADAVEAAYLEANRVEAQRRTIRKLARGLEVDPAELVGD